MDKPNNKHISNIEEQCLNNMQIKWQKLYEVLIVILIFLPIVTSPILMGVFNQKALGIIVIIISLALLIILAIIRKKIIKSSFYKIKDVEQRCKVIEVRNLTTLKFLYETSALTIIEKPEPRLLNILYNWLNNMQAIAVEELPIYTFEAKKLKEEFNYSGIPDKYKIICISSKDLNLNDDNLKIFGEQHFIFGRYLDDIIDNEIK